MATILFTDSSSDLSTQLRKQHHIEYFRMGIVVNGEEKYADIDWEDYSPEELYSWVSNLSYKCKTTQVSILEFKNKMEPFLKNGDDILYLSCALALSGSLNTFQLVASQLQEEYPKSKIIGIDSTKANMALGLMAIDLSKLVNQGKPMDDLLKWVKDNRQFYNQVGSLETLTFLKAAGRVSGVSAFFGNLIGVKPMIMADIHGNNYVYTKVKGKTNSLIAAFDYVKKNMVEGVTDVVYIGQAMAKPQQAYLKERIENELGLKTENFWIGPIVGISCGPGMFGVYFKGKEVRADANGEEQ